MFVIQTAKLAVTSELNYDLLMLEKILNNKFNLFHEQFNLINYFNAVKYKKLSFM